MTGEQPAYDHNQLSRITEWEKYAMNDIMANMPYWPRYGRHQVVYNKGCKYSGITSCCTSNAMGISGYR